MLQVLRINNLVLIDQIEIEFGPKLNVLTGETGAGKSILLKAIELLTGKRATAELIRAGEERCQVEGLFSLDQHTLRSLSELSDEFAEIVSSDELLIRRVIEANGRSKVYVNGSLTTSQLLQRVTARLIDITGQHQQQTLLDDDNHIHVLDEFGVPNELLAEVETAYEVFAKAQRELEAFQKNARERTLYYERIRDELDELVQAALKDNERSLLEVEEQRLAHVETLGETIRFSLEAIDESDDNLERRIRGLASQLAHAAKIDPTLEEAVELVENSAVQLAEAKRFLQHYGASLEADPAALEQLRTRIADIARLERKYHLSTSELLQYQDKIAAEVAAFEAGGLDEQQLAARRDTAKAVLHSHEGTLTAARTSAATKLALAVELGLKELNMKKARFEVAIAAGNSSRLGCDQVLFTLSANPGEPLRAISKVASGGELSRILLVLKTVLNERHSPHTQIFDEIDSGIGGAVAQTVGEKLQRIAERAQVLVVSHSPQIAALADTHFLIAKSSSETRTSTEVSRLDTEGRVQQIAGMLAGKQITSQFEDSARALLSGAAPQKKTRARAKTE